MSSRIHLLQRDGYYRMVDASGKTATSLKGFALDKGGYKSLTKALTEMRIVNKSRSSLKSLYIHRPLLNAHLFLDHFHRQGFKHLLDASDLHVTIAFSRKPVDWSGITLDDHHLRTTGFLAARTVEPLGDEGAIVQKFFDNTLYNRWLSLCSDHGASWDYDQYQPHVTLTYIGDDGIDPSKVEPFYGDLIFGPEKRSVVIEDWEVGRE